MYFITGRIRVTRGGRLIYIVLHLSACTVQVQVGGSWVYYQPRLLYASFTDVRVHERVVYVLVGSSFVNAST